VLREDLFVLRNVSEETMFNTKYHCTLFPMARSFPLM